MHTDGRAYSILVVSPDAAIRQSLRFLFEVEGFEVADSDALPVQGDERGFADVSCIVVDGLDPAKLDPPPGAPPLVVLVDAAVPDPRDGVAIVAKPTSGRTLFDLVEQACRRARATLPPATP
jgi:FixJ family two-component response regulator